MEHEIETDRLSPVQTLTCTSEALLISPASLSPGILLVKAFVTAIRQREAMQTRCKHLQSETATEACHLVLMSEADSPGPLKDSQPATICEEAISSVTEGTSPVYYGSSSNRPRHRQRKASAKTFGRLAITSYSPLDCSETPVTG